MLYAAHRISLDFLSVSSILQAVKRAAAAASCTLSVSIKLVHRLIYLQYSHLLRGGLNETYDNRLPQYYMFAQACLS